MFDLWKTIAFSIGFVCVGCAIAAGVFFYLSAQDAAEGDHATGCIGAGITLSLLSLAGICFFYSLYV